jgi:exo-1,4-beta-D-glucosaminidase
VRALARLFAVLTLLAAFASIAEAGDPLRLSAGWRLQSSARVHLSGAALSRPGANVTGWHTTIVPSTVVAALVAGRPDEDLFKGMNFRALAGMSYPVGGQFSNLPMPPESPYARAWWYRDEFRVPASLAGRAVALHFDGINYRANVWLNGVQIAKAVSVAGAFRRYEFDVTRTLRPGARNALAVEVFAPTPGDLGINWVDWNPTPPDKNMGLWGAVYLTDSGALTLRHPYFKTALDLPSLSSADLTFVADVRNTTDAPVQGLVRLQIESIAAEVPIALDAHERRTIHVGPAEAPQLHVANPRVWWPYRMGAPNMYAASVSLETGGRVSDTADLHFGIRQVTSELTDKGYRLFRINGKPILIRGGGWSSDVLERPLTPQRLEAQLRYVREMGLNTIRQEGKLETDDFYDATDRLGILVMPGWCCCDQWEKWDKWDAENYTVGPDSLRDQLLRLRTHPSIFVWLNGSDKPPIATVERKYLQIEHDVEWDRPTVSSAAEAPGPVSGPSGVKMRGPYDYVPPSYWLSDVKNGGAFGFATEISPGPAVPPLESLRALLTPDHLWPIDSVWNYHAGGGQFKTINTFTAALDARYGPARDAADYARKAQALTYEGERAMFEGYARNKYTSTGVIQWMLNNAWPSIIWHLYDWYLRPGGGYFGTKAACEPIHVQYSYDDKSIVVVNDTQDAAKGLTVSAKLLDFSMKERFAKSASLELPADGVVRAFTVPDLADVTPTYFLSLTVSKGSDVVSRNFYWLSATADTLAWDKSTWYYTPTLRHGDLTALSSLPQTHVSAQITLDTTDAQERGGRVTLRNSGSAIAFQIHLTAVDASGAEILPIYWQDNYISLLPGERRQVQFAVPAWAGTPSTVRIEGWNVSNP